jgi:hypothetical protein
MPELLPVDYDPFQDVHGSGPKGNVAESVINSVASLKKPAQDFWSGGLMGLVKGQGAATPQWSDRIGEVLDSPNVNIALGMVGGFKNTDWLSSLREQMDNDRLLGAETLNPEPRAEKIANNPNLTERHRIIARGLDRYSSDVHNVLRPGVDWSESPSWNAKISKTPSAIASAKRDKEYHSEERWQRRKWAMMPGAKFENGNFSGFAPGFEPPDYKLIPVDHDPFKEK